MKKEKAAFFDIDGTLVKGFLIVDFPKFLLEKKLILSDHFVEIQNIFKSFVSGQLDASVVAKLIPEHFAKGIKGYKIKDMNPLVDQFVKEKVITFPYTKKALNYLKNKKYSIIAMSGSPNFILKHLKLGFSKTYGTELEIVDGVFTGKIIDNLVLSKNKRKRFNTTITEDGIKLSKCYAFGDTEHDLPILKSVGHPIIVNPTKNLLKATKAKNWPKLSSISDFETIFHK